METQSMESDLSLCFTSAGRFQIHLINQPYVDGNADRAATPQTACNVFQRREVVVRRYVVINIEEQTEKKFEKRRWGEGRTRIGEMDTHRPNSNGPSASS